MRQPHHAQPVPKQWLAIINPAAGRACRKSFRQKWLPRIECATTKTIFTEGPGHAGRIAASAREYDGVVAAGGDGTIFEILGGIDRDRQCIAVLPCGRGNSIARDLGVKTMARGLESITSGAPRCIDLLFAEAVHRDGRVTHAMSASTIGVGYIATVADRARRFHHLGAHSYSIASVLVLPRMVAAWISYNGEPRTICDLTGLLISNVAHVARFRAFPDARPDDNLLHVMELDAPWPRQVVHNISILAQKYGVKPKFTGAKRTVDIHIDPPGQVLIDGELLGDIAELRIRCVPRSAIFQSLPS